MTNTPEPRFLFGLGNPGERYCKTRHNVGNCFLQYLLKESFASIEKKQQLSIYTAAFCQLFGKSLYLVWPHTFMNNSGQGYAFFCQKHNFEPDEGLLIYDDLDIPLGQARIKPKGGAGGHRGLLSVFAWMETERIPRLRIGVGREKMPPDVTSYLLSDFSREEEKTVLGVFGQCSQALEYLLLRDLKQAMTFLNRSPSPPADDQEEGIE